jgi:hypothetical protein
MSGWRSKPPNYNPDAALRPRAPYARRRRAVRAMVPPCWRPARSQRRQHRYDLSDPEAMELIKGGVRTLTKRPPRILAKSLWPAIARRGQQRFLSKVFVGRTRSGQAGALKAKAAWVMISPRTCEWSGRIAHVNWASRVISALMILATGQVLGFPGQFVRTSLHSLLPHRASCGS